jgi:hypothetical protein
MAPPRGTRHPLTHLTWPDVLAIRAAASHGTAVKALARTYHVDPHTIRDILDHKTWLEPDELQGVI